MAARPPSGYVSVNKKQSLSGASNTSSSDTTINVLEPLLQPISTNNDTGVNIENSQNPHDKLLLEDEAEKREARDKFSSTSSPRIAAITRPKTLSLSKSSSNNTSGMWSSHDYDDAYTRHECDEQCSSLLHIAAKMGNVDSLELLLEERVNDPNKRDCLGRTPFHNSVNLLCNCETCVANAAKCTQLLVDSAKTDINAVDFNGETALHYASETQSIKCASILLYSGADVTIKSKAGIKALTLMVEKIPEAMDSLLNRAVSVEKYDPSNVSCELKLDFGAIVGYSEARGYSMRAGGKSVGNNGVMKNGFANADGTNIKSRKEMQLLTSLLDCSSSSRKRILTHPLIAIFLHLKWKRVRTVFWATIGFHVALLLLYTIYILDVYLISCPYRPKITEPAAVKAAKAEGNYVESENATYRAEFIKFSWFQFSPQLQELGVNSGLDGDGCPLEIGPTVKSILLLTLTGFMSINEIFKMLPAPRAYIKRNNNKLLWILFFFILLTSWPVFMRALMLVQIGKFPILGLYVEILTKVLKNFGFFIVTYASLLIAFALSFCVLFPGNAPYSSIPLSILKVLMMMVGEVNYEDLFYGNEENPVDDLLYPITGHVLYGLFVIMITIVLMNLLVGLTVSDIQRRQFCIQGLQKDAELTRVSSQIGEISQLEKFVFSKRVQSFVPKSVAAFLRESVLVVRTKGNKDPTLIASPTLAPKSKEYDESWFFRFRPNDPNDKSLPEELKIAVLRLAAIRFRTKRTNKCTKNTLSCPPPLATPLIDDYTQQYSQYAATSSASTPIWQPPIRSLHGPPWVRRHVGLGSTTPAIATTRDQQEYNTYFMRRLEEKIMDRMKIQMDTLYQRIEDKLFDH